jgi:hypothetical protein
VVMKRLLVIAIITGAFSTSLALEKGEIETKIESGEAEEVCSVLDKHLEKSDDDKYELEKVELYKFDKMTRIETKKAKIQYKVKKGNTKVQKEAEIDEADTEKLKIALRPYISKKENRRVKALKVSDLKCTSKSDCTIKEEQ